MKSPDIPKARGALPLVGHAPRLFHRPHEFLTGLPAYGDLVEIRLGPVRAVVVCDPELTRQVLRGDRVFDKGGVIYRRLRELGGDGLVTSTHDRHRRQRRLTGHALHSANLPGYARTMTRQIDSLTERWGDGQVLDVPAEMLGFTMRVLTETMFSSALPRHALGETVEDLVVIMRGILRRSVVPAPLNQIPTRGNRRYQRALAHLRTTLDAVIADRRAAPREGEDLLSRLLSARDVADGGHGLTDREVADNVITFFVAGSETTANALAWALHLLARHPRIEDRLHTEVRQVLGDGPAGYDHLPRLGLTKRVIAETLRLYPPALMFTRITTTDTELGRHRLPAGTTVVFSPYVIHHRADLHDDPESFDPSRWESMPPARGDYVPFGSGPRKCVGEQFGMTEATLALATITARWHLESVPGRRVRTAMSLNPHGLRMRVVART
ncbi:cytochrome P450 [Actinomadura sp. NEAU-AAG7]|uniref:cytochrome P450 n=1 Tax=Actinomadura sp. NEAU-AAG7 TaxID=2839640 RepID=UPI001BE4C9E5|nr:cytochrome P450 [Actinomadura sp. NEAU-AAG7]MBT2206798.1 cytochrome P450 [Actinomadura sp. NEAU-AAG7]